MAKKTKPTGWYGGLILLECVLWGVGNPVIKIALGQLTLFYSLALRFGLAFLLFAVFFGRQALRQLNRRNLPWGLLISALNASAFFVATYALTLTQATTAGFLMGVAAIFTPFLSVWLLKKPLDTRVLALVALVVAGMYLLCTGAGNFTFGPGEALSLLSSLLFALTLVLSQKHIQGIGPLALSTLQAGTAAVLAIVPALLWEDIHVLAGLSGTTWAAVLYTAVGSTFVAYLMQNLALRHVSAVFASLAFCSEPVFTAIASAILLGERLNAPGYVGGGMIVAGLVLSALNENRARRVP